MSDPSTTSDMPMTSVPAYGVPQRGVSAADVERAADALLRQGLRPTIERVRGELGSGSPNTINPLLDAWWKKLAGRLDDGPAALHRLPEPVLHVAEALWVQALEAGRARARLELKSKAQAMELEARDIEVRTHVLSLRESELEQRLRGREQLLEETRQQMLQLLGAVQRDQATLRAREARIAALEGEIARYHDGVRTSITRAVERRQAARAPRARAAPKPATAQRTAVPKARKAKRAQRTAPVAPLRRPLRRPIRRVRRAR